LAAGRQTDDQWTVRIDLTSGRVLNNFRRDPDQRRPRPARTKKGMSLRAAAATSSRLVPPGVGCSMAIALGLTGSGTRSSLDAPVLGSGPCISCGRTLDSVGGGRQDRSQPSAGLVAQGRGGSHQCGGSGLNRCPVLGCVAPPWWPWRICRIGRGQWCLHWPPPCVWMARCVVGRGGTVGCEGAGQCLLGAFWATAPGEFGSLLTCGHDPPLWIDRLSPSFRSWRGFTSPLGFDRY
jgi:hypothetical protein